MSDNPRLNQVIDVLMLAGTILSQSGSEIHRVEDTMIRIAHSQGIEGANVLAIPAAIFFSIDNTNISRMKRITHSSYNMEKVCDVNQISRQLVAGQMTLEEAFKELTIIKSKGLPYKDWQVTIAAAISAPFFTIMFGGNIFDALGGFIATLLGFLGFLFADKLIRIPFVSCFLGAFIFTLLSLSWGKYSGFAISPDLINAGAVMPFVPGIAMTNSVRDLMTNHINSGMSKLFETILITLALGAGTTVALLLMK